MSTIEKHLTHAEKVVQKVAEYHSKMAATSKTGVFSKLDPKIRTNIYSSLFEDVLKPDENDTPCPCRLTPSKCGHSGNYVYKPLKHLRPFLALLVTRKLFRSEAQALLHVEYIPKTAWVVRGKEGPEQIRDFLCCIRPQNPEKMLFSWRLEDIVVGSAPVHIGGMNLLSDGVADWLAAAIYRHDQVYKEREKAEDAKFQKLLQKARSPPGPPQSDREMGQEIEHTLERLNLPRSYRTGKTGVSSTRRFYLGHKYLSSGEKVSVVVNGSLQRLSWKVREMVERKKESKERYERIVRM